jgi:hypothetical protein
MAPWFLAGVLLERSASVFATVPIRDLMVRSQKAEPWRRNSPKLFSEDIVVANVAVFRLAWSGNAAQKSGIIQCVPFANELRVMIICVKACPY